MDNIQTEFNTDDIRNIVEEGVIENVQGEDERTDNVEPHLE